jgi:hypothetical protein
VKKRRERDERWNDGYIPDPTTYLRGERWEDELEDRDDPRTEEERQAEADRLRRFLDG